MSLLHMKVVDISDVNLLQKIDDLDKAFCAKFGDPPKFFIRCPGRVNIIGEHVDYSMYPVFPLAIEQDVLLAVGSNCEKLDISNFHEIYPAVALSFNEIPEEPALDNLEWYHYIIAGVLAIAKKYDLQPKMNILVHGTIPVAAGLSSSSALVCASAMATVFFYGLHERAELGKKGLAEICAKAEMYVGTKGGGMDQAIIFYAQNGFATKIDFFPSLNTQNICLPNDVEFVVAHSGVKVQKAATNRFNKRVAECKLAAKVIACLADVNWKNVSNLRDLAHFVKKNPSEMIDFINNKNMNKVYTGREICNILQINSDELEEILHGFQLQKVDYDDFKLLQRARHVYNECVNVETFIQACEEKNLIKLGQAMINSHNSLRDDYECSHSKLDALVHCALQLGALGARLTGAGWGGYIVAAVEKNNLSRVEEGLKNYAESNGLSRDTVFRTKPCQGAAIIENMTAVDEASFCCIDSGLK